VLAADADAAAPPLSSPRAEDHDADEDDQDVEEEEAALLAASHSSGGLGDGDGAAPFLRAKMLKRWLGCLGVMATVKGELVMVAVGRRVIDQCSPRHWISVSLSKYLPNERGFRTRCMTWRAFQH
jgi:hypothetical protein